MGGKPENTLASLRPDRLVEINGEKPTGDVRQHGVDTQRPRSAQVRIDCLIGEETKSLVRIGAAPASGLLAPARLPFIVAYRHVAVFPGAGVLPAFRIDVVSAAKE